MWKSRKIPAHRDAVHHPKEGMDPMRRPDNGVVRCLVCGSANINHKWGIRKLGWLVAVSVKVFLQPMVTPPIAIAWNVSPICRGDGWDIGMSSHDQLPSHSCIGDV